jgi:hypothetical protein
MNIVIARGIAIPRWCNATSVMIEKDAGNPRIHRLRIIHLFEADSNFFLKIQWGHRLVRQAVELDLLHASQHGSTPGRTTNEGFTSGSTRIAGLNCLQSINALGFQPLGGAGTPCASFARGHYCKAGICH